MKTLETGDDKIKHICKLLKEESLEPAKQEAKELIEAAKQEAASIISKAKKEADTIEKEAKANVEKERISFQSTLQQAAKNTLEALKLRIEKEFFNSSLPSIIADGINLPNLIADLVEAIVKALEKEGLSCDLTTQIPKSIDPAKVVALLAQETLKKLKNNSIEIGDFAAGVKVIASSQHITIDMSENALKELLSSYVLRKEFRKMIFSQDSE